MHYLFRIRVIYGFAVVFIGRAPVFNYNKLICKKRNHFIKMSNTRRVRRNSPMKIAFPLALMAFPLKDCLNLNRAAHALELRVKSAQCVRSSRVNEARRPCYRELARCIAYRITITTTITRIRAEKTKRVQNQKKMMMMMNFFRHHATNISRCLLICN